MGCSISKKSQVQSTLSINQPKRVTTKEQVPINPGQFVSRKTDSILKDYRIGACLGKGAFGQVRIATHRPTRQARAVKSILKTSITPDMRGKSRFFQEVDILKRTDHPNIVKIYEFYEDEKSYHVITEYIKGGELFDFILKSRRLSETIAAHFFKQLVSAIAYCHENGIVHRDLKPENLLLEKAEPDSILKVIDFGTSTLFEASKKLTKAYGTVYYIAPEVLHKNYNEKCDIWSCGVILFTLLSGKPPFNGSNDIEILQKVEKGIYKLNDPVWTTISNEAKNLIKSMLKIDPKKRPSASEVLAFPWLKTNALAPKVDEAVKIEAIESLRSFQHTEKLQHAVLAFISSQILSKEETRQLTSTFNALDTNGDGKISREELTMAFSANLNLEIAEEEVEKIMSQVDSDSNGYINYSEFVTATIKRKNLLSKENLEAAFSMFDHDNSGKISANELRKLMGSDLLAEDSVWNEIISQADSNGDGEVDLEEFKNMMMKVF